MANGTLLALLTCMGGDRFTYLPGDVVEVESAAEARRWVETATAAPAPEKATPKYRHRADGRSENIAEMAAAAGVEPSQPKPGSDAGGGATGVRAVAPGASGPSTPGAADPSSPPPKDKKKGK